jgi:hypothetical protein
MNLKSSIIANSGSKPLFLSPVMAAIAISAFTLCAIVGVIVRANIRGIPPIHPESGPTVPTPAGAPAVISSAPATSVTPLQQDDTQAKLVTISPGGFEPQQLLVTQKRFLLAIENRCRLDTISLRLSRADSGFLASTTMARGRLLWSQLFTLPAGQYILTEDSHPDWVCTITVRPR